MKRAGSDSPRRSASPPQARPPEMDGTDETDKAESFEDSGDDPLEQDLACMNDLSRPAAERDAAIRRCIAGLPVDPQAGILCLADHWPVLEAITRLDAPAECAELFATACLTQPGAPLAANRCMQCVERVKTIRAALAALGLHKTPIGCSAVAKHVLGMVTLLELCPLAGGKLLGMAFQGHEPLMPDVYLALCAEIDIGPRPSSWSCFVALTSLYGMPDGYGLDPMPAAKALGGENEDLKTLVVLELTRCRELIQVAGALECGNWEAALDSGEMARKHREPIERLMQACAHEARGDGILNLMNYLWVWGRSILRQLQ